MIKLTENQTIRLLTDYLIGKGWTIESVCLGQERGCDIMASLGDRKLCVEVKGARAADDAPTKKKESFNNSQIKTHFGMALIQTLEAMEKYPDENTSFAIAHPDDPQIHKVVDKLIPYLRKLGICHFWVSQHGIILVE